MRDNVFDSIPYNTVSGEDNVFAHFLQTAGLYDFMEINKSNINDLVILLDGKVRISAYCKNVRQSVFLQWNRIFISRKIGVGVIHKNFLKKF